MERRRLAPPSGGVSQIEASGLKFADFAALFEAAQPSTQGEKALAGAYWLQVVQGRADFDSQTLNTDLKQLGHGVANVTSALDQLIRRRPQMVLQVRKSGTSKQARKKYRLTNEGIKRVKTMLLAGESDGDNGTN
jgi:hypothetical protein